MVIAVAFFHRLQRAIQCERIPGLLSRCREEGFTFQYISELDPESMTSRRSSRIKWTATGMPGVTSGCSSAGGIILSDLSYRAQEQAQTFLYLHLSLLPAVDPRAGSKREAFAPFQGYVMLPREMIHDVGSVRRIVSHLSECFHIEYAFVFPAETFTDGLREVTLGVVSPRTPLDAIEQARGKRLFGCFTERTELGRATCGGYWANYLGSSIVDRLGGPSRVLKDAPGTTRIAMGNGVYIQATERLPAGRLLPESAELSTLSVFLHPVLATSTTTK